MDDQHPELQQDALRDAGCVKIFTDHSTGSTTQRPALAQVKEHVRVGDTLVIWRLDRLGRSLKDVLAWGIYLEEHGMGLKRLQEALDTTTAIRRLVFHIFAEFEHNLIRERTQAGLAAARARGRTGGRAKALPPAQRQRAAALYHQKELTIREICALFGIAKPTLYSYVREYPPRVIPTHT